MMGDVMEKRTSKRHASDTSVVCSFLTDGRMDKTYDGKMRNYCTSGIYAELNGKLQKGLILLIKTRPAPEDSGHREIKEGFRTISLAQVQWSKPMSCRGQTLYGTGLKYL